MSDNLLYQSETEDDQNNGEPAEELFEEDNEGGVDNSILDELQTSFDQLETHTVYDAIDTSELWTVRVIGQSEFTPGPGPIEDDEEEAEHGGVRPERIKTASLEGIF